MLRQKETSPAIKTKLDASPKYIMSYSNIICSFPNNSSKFPIPGNIFRFPNKFCRSPETDILRVGNPSSLLTYFLLKRVQHHSNYIFSEQI